jgi:hypothetical protein
VSKVPQFVRHGEVFVQGGGFSEVRGGVDVGGPIQSFQPVGLDRGVGVAPADQRHAVEEDRRVEAADQELLQPGRAGAAALLGGDARGVAQRLVDAERVLYGPGGAQGAVPGYVASRSTVATKTDTPILETAQSISVIGRKQIEDQNALSINQALRYTPSVTTEQRGGAGSTRLEQFPRIGVSVLVATVLRLAT